AIGVALLRQAPGNTLLPVLGVAVALYGLYRLREPVTRKFLSPRWGYITGLTGGFVGGLFGIGGPIYATYMSRRTNDYAKMRATMAAIFTVSTAFRIVAFLIAGFFLDREVWWGVAVILPFMLIGLNIGHKLHGKLERKHLSYFISLLLVASGLSLIARVFA
ncbi:MAG: TSUP family transporter, partial [Burkholderiales bacterium]|nr:TSUP family transporter [Burkholderiales bacterium]